MARFEKGQSMKDQRVHVVSSFAQKGPGMTGQNVAFSISNDTREGEDVKTAPMLKYDTYKDKEGNTKDTYTENYSASQWAEVEAAANKDGDAMVLIADLFPSKNGKGLVVNTNTLRTPDEPFNLEQHRETTSNERIARREAREAAQAVEAEKEAAGTETEKESEMSR